MAAKPLSRKDAKRTLKAIREAGSYSGAASALDVSPSTVRSRVNTIAALYPDLDIPQGGTGGPAPKERTLGEDVALHKAQADSRRDARQLKAAIAEITVLQDRIAELNWSSNVAVTPAEWTLDTRAPKSKSPHIPLLFFSDAQAGAVVRADETDAPWDYDSAIFRTRYRKMISASIDLSMNHGGTRWAYPGCVYARGGDNISGGLHEDLRELGEDNTAIQQSELVFEEEAAGIAKLAEAFGKVEVKSVPGNHDRTTHKPMTKLAWARSFDHLIHKMLANHFKQDTRVSFQTSRSPDIRFPIFEKRMLMSHGDKIGSRGGMGFVGPGATILRGWQKLRMEQARLGYMVDMIMTGHFHYPMDLPTLGIANGSFTGTTEFGKMFRMEPLPPLQYLSFFHHRHGCVDIRPIYLAD